MGDAPSPERSVGLGDEAEAESSLKLPVEIIFHDDHFDTRACLPVNHCLLSAVYDGRNVPWC